MTVRGTLKADALTVARINIDFLVNPTKVHTLAALVETGGGQTLGWIEGSSAVFSTATMAKLQELREAMERDIAQRVFTEIDAPVTSARSRGGADMGGLGEHIGADAPSI
jgi:hypothetical protein